jgi:hypothetical protein
MYGCGTQHPFVASFGSKFARGALSVGMLLESECHNEEQLEFCYNYLLFSNIAPGREKTMNACRIAAASYLFDGSACSD